MSAPFNESALPISHDDRPGAYTAEPGMTLRDYFAAKAMAVYLLPDPTSGAWSGESEFCGLAALAYKAADAMLKARAAAQGDAL